jgi:CDP-diacylglycerol--glycerol-3-phosphate 3-phosphatidyltransferase
MDDAAFIEALESGTLPGHEMNHAAHLRLALVFRGQPEKAREVLLKYVDRIGAQVKYNETLTWFWLRAVNAHEGETVKELMATPLADTNLPFRHWSPELLWSEAARTQWVDPDLRPLDF